MLLNLFQVRLRARDAAEGHVAEGTVRAEPVNVHPGEELEVVVDVRFAEGGPPGSIDVKVSPPEDFDTEEPRVEMGPDGAVVTIPAGTDEEVELGTYYLQVVYSDEEREHFEAEAPLEVERHWVRLGRAVAQPTRASPGDPVDLVVPLSFEGQDRVRGHIRGRLVPEDWDGSDGTTIKLPRERCSVSDSREQTWHVRVPKNAPHGRYNADVEFSSREGTARRRTRRVLMLVHPRAIEASVPAVEPAMMAPGDEVTIRTRAQNVGREELDVRVGGEVVPEAGGAAMDLVEQDIFLDPGEAADLEWTVSAPDRHGRWVARLRARADRTDGADPPTAVLDVRPPHQVHVVGAVPNRPWAAPGERVEVALQLMDSGSRPGHDASVSVVLEGEAGERTSEVWSGWLGSGVEEPNVTVRVPTPPVSGAGTGEGTSTRFALVVRGADGEELLRTPGAVAVRRRVRILPHIVRGEPDPLHLGDALLSGERVVRTADAGTLSIVELSSGCRLYARGDLVAGVDAEMPMDDDFWDEALDADARLYTDVKAGAEAGASAARAEAIVMRALATSLGGKEARATGLVKEGRELARTMDPVKRARGVSPRGGSLAPLAAWLADPYAPPEGGRRLVPDLRRQLTDAWEPTGGEEGLQAATSAARAASDHLARLADILGRVWREDHIDCRSIQAAAALVAAAGVAQVELNRLRETCDPWPSPAQTSEEAKVALQSMSAQLGSLLELLSRHRLRRDACTMNTQQRASHAAVVRDLEVEAAPVVGHSGDAVNMDVVLENRSHHDLELRLNVAMPTSAWTILEPPGRGSEGLVSVGPVFVPARSTERATLAVYVPTTVQQVSYVLPIEVVPEPREIVPEQRGGAR